MKANNIYVYNEKELEDAVVTLRDLSLLSEDVEVKMYFPSEQMTSLFIESSMRDTREQGINPTNNVKVNVYHKSQKNRKTKTNN